MMFREAMPPIGIFQVHKAQHCIINGTSKVNLSQLLVNLMHNLMISMCMKW
jgi:hypothetical protein